MTATHEDLVRRYFLELFNRRDLNAVGEVVADVYVEHAAAPFAQTEPGVVDGPSTTRATISWLVAQFPDLHFTIEALVRQDDVVAVRVLGKGTNLGPIGPIPPTGQRFSSRSSHWFRVADGRLAEHWATRDDLASMLQLGVLAVPGSAR
jgi:predicted ester cyclase